MTSATRPRETKASQSPCSLDTFQRTSWAGAGCSAPLRHAHRPTISGVHPGYCLCPQPCQMIVFRITSVHHQRSFMHQAGLLIATCTCRGAYNSPAAGRTVRLLTIVRKCIEARWHPLVQFRSRSDRAQAPQLQAICRADFCGHMNRALRCPVTPRRRRSR